MHRPIAGIVFLLLVADCTTPTRPTQAAAPTITPQTTPREVSATTCIRVLDVAEASFTFLAEAVRGYQQQVDALLANNRVAFDLGRQRAAAARARVTPASEMVADSDACKASASPPPGAATRTPSSCIRSLDHFSRAFGLLVVSMEAMQAQVTALETGNVNAYQRGKTAYAEAFAEIRAIDQPLREDHTDCRNKAAKALRRF